MRAVLLGVMTARLGMMVSSMRGMAVRGMSVMRGLFVIATLVVLGGFAVMLSGLLMVLSGLVVMFGSLMGHGFSPLHSAHARSMRLLWGELDCAA